MQLATLTSWGLLFSGIYVEPDPESPGEEVYRPIHPLKTGECAKSRIKLMAAPLFGLLTTKEGYLRMYYSAEIEGGLILLERPTAATNLTFKWVKQVYKAHLIESLYVPNSKEEAAQIWRIFDNGWILGEPGRITWQVDGEYKYSKMEKIQDWPEGIE